MTDIPLLQALRRAYARVDAGSLRLLGRAMACASRSIGRETRAGADPAQQARQRAIRRGRWDDRQHDPRC